MSTTSTLAPALTRHTSQPQAKHMPTCVTRAGAVAPAAAVLFLAYPALRPWHNETWPPERPRRWAPAAGWPPISH